MPTVAIIRNDGFTTSRPWCADIKFEDGTFWKSWAHGYRTKQELIRDIKSASPNCEIA